MKKKNTLQTLLATLLLILFFSTVNPLLSQGIPKAQRKELRSLLKAEKYSDADKLLDRIVKEQPALSNDAEVINNIVIVQDKLAQAENRKIYLNNKPDTVKYFSHIYSIYSNGMRYRVPEGTKDDGKASKNISQLMCTYRNNLRSAGKYFYAKKDYPNAFRYIDMYISSDTTSFIRQSNCNMESDSIAMAKLALFSAYSNKDYANVFHYSSKATADSLNLESIKEVIARSATEAGDSALMLATLVEASKLFPRNEYFYTTLIRYYTNHTYYHEALEVIEYHLSFLPREPKLWYIKGKTEECLSLPDSALISYNTQLALDSTASETFSSMGNIYISKAHDYASSHNEKAGTNRYRRVQREINAIYAKAETYFEKARELQPQTSSLWLQGLSECYFKLNKGDKLRSLEKKSNK